MPFVTPCARASGVSLTPHEIAAPRDANACLHSTSAVNLPALCLCRGLSREYRYEYHSFCLRCALTQPLQHVDVLHVRLPPVAKA